MRFDPRKPHDPANDRFVLSKGHAAPLLYAAWAETGHFRESELVRLRKMDCDLEGHPTARLDFVDVATGSLGQGLSAGVGLALNARLSKIPYRVYVLMGDGELAEGSVWEGANFAAIQRLKNLVAIVDANRLGQNRATAFGHDVEVYRKRFESFGWRARIVDGHSVTKIQEMLKLLDEEDPLDRPLALIARTIKGKGIPGVEDQLGWHGKALSPEVAKKAIAALEPLSESALGEKIPAPAVVLDSEEADDFVGSSSLPSEPQYPVNQAVSTRKAFGNALVRLGGSNPQLVVLDGDVGNSTYSDQFRDHFPERFIECYIGEQNMVGTAVGLSKMGKVPVCATFGAFFSRAADQIRMAAPSFANLKLVGTHTGVSIGEDGVSQMALEDVAILRAIEGSTVLSPCDAMSAERLVERMLESKGLVYLRAARPDVPIIYGVDERFEIGGAKILRQASQDQLTVVATGVTVFEALSAWEKLALQGIHVTVIDAYSIKPLAREIIGEAAARTNGLIVSVEDHYAQGGLGEALASELGSEGIRVHKLAIRELPHSGTPRELLERYRIDSKAIADEVRYVLAKSRSQAA